jgi:beta-lactam-binding protein with PASTA domain
MRLFKWRQSLARIILAIAAVLVTNAVAETRTVFGQVSLPVPQATPAALIESIVVQNREIIETDELQPQATVTRGSETVRIVLPFFLYKGDAIETTADTKITVLFLDDPVAERRNRIIIYPKAKVSIGSGDSWWGRAWAKVKGAFTSRTRYSRLSAEGTEYELNVSETDDRAVLTVIEGTVRVVEGEENIGAALPQPKHLSEFAAITTAAPRFVLANFAGPFPQSQFGRVVNVPAGQTTSLMITYNVGSDCSQTHSFKFQTSDGAEWFSIIGEKNFQIRGPRGSVSETRQVQIDATRLAPGTYDVHVYAICLDCDTEAGCRRAPLDWTYRVVVEGPGIPGGTSTPTPTPTPPTPTDQTFRVSQKQQSSISKQTDQVIPASDSDLRFILNWTGAVLIATQPTYSAQNLIPHFSTVAERNSTFTSARERSVFTNDAAAYAELGNVYSDWSQGAWASAAYEKESNRAASSIDLAEAYRASGKLREAEQTSQSFATDSSARARNFFGNLALDSARIALDAGNLQEAEGRAANARREYGAALNAPAGTPASANRAVNANVAEANIIAGEAALQRNAAPDARTMFAEAARSLESIQQASSIYPFPVTDLGVAYRGQGDAAVMSGDLLAATAAYANAKRQHEQAIAAHRDFSEAYFNLGDLYDNLGDRENAKANYFLAIKNRPEQPAAYLPLALLVKDEDSALAAALAATFLKLEREPLRHGRNADTARKLADRQPIVRPARIGERLGAVPNLIGATRDDAFNRITAAGFKVGRTELRNSTSTPGLVLEQNPAVGARPAAGSEINLVISQLGTGDVIVPNVVGKPVSAARAELQNLGLAVDLSQTKADTKQPRDYVIQQSPKDKKTVKTGTTVKLVISAGDLVEIPDVRGKELDDARKKITSGNKLTVGREEYRQDCRVNEVLQQDPLPTKQKTADRGTAINLVVGSLGDNPVIIPPFRTRESAEIFVNENRLRLKRVREEESEATAGTVLRQSPKANRQFGRNCPVDIELTVAIPIVYVDIENYVNQPVDVVEQRLRALDLFPLVRHQNYSDATPGTVIQQSPAGPTRVRHRSFVYLVVATQPQIPTVTVPNLCGKTLKEARAILNSPQFGLINTDNNVSYASPPGDNSCANLDSMVNGQIMWQDPPANAKVPRGTPVNLWIVNKISRSPAHPKLTGSESRADK